MIPAEFDYVAPDTLEDALKELREGGEDGDSGSSAGAGRA